jgi:hypothetical protein
LRGEVRSLLRESAEGYWTNAQLLEWANQSIDLRSMELGLAVEGYLTEEASDSIVSGTRNYAIPEGGGKIRRVLIVRDDGNGTYEVPVPRDERWHSPSYRPTSAVSGSGWRPTGRFVGSNLELTPTPRENITDGLRWEIECAGARLTGDASTLPLQFPDVAETLLIYDVVALALASENAQTELDKEYTSGLLALRDQYQDRWLAYIENRWQAPVQGKPFYLGD